MTSDLVYTRVPFDAVVHFQCGGTMEVAEAVSLTPEELVFATPHPPSAGVHIRVRFKIEGGPRIFVPGEVLATGEFSPSGKGALVRLLDLTPLQRNALEALWREAGGEQIPATEGGPAASPFEPTAEVGAPDEAAAAAIDVAPAVPETDPVPEPVLTDPAKRDFDLASIVTEGSTAALVPDHRTLEGLREMRASFDAEEIEGASDADAVPEALTRDLDGEAPEELSVEVEALGPGDGGTLAFRVTYRSRKAFLREYHSNLGKGGFFLPTEHVLERLAPVTVELVLPDSSETLSLDGSVVHRVEADPSRGKSPGLGIHFRHAGPEDLDPVHEAARRLGETES